jgi:hypothetical protein
MIVPQSMIKRSWEGSDPNALMLTVGVLVVAVVEVAVVVDVEAAGLGVEAGDVDVEGVGGAGVVGFGDESEVPGVFSECWSC